MAPRKNSETDETKDTGFSFVEPTPVAKEVSVPSMPPGTVVVEHMKFTGKVDITLLDGTNLPVGVKQRGKDKVHISRPVLRRLLPATVYKLAEQGVVKITEVGGNS